MSTIETLQQDIVKNIFLKNHIDSVSLIWLYPRGEENKESNIDLIFTVMDNEKITLLDLVRLKSELEERLGKTVDLHEESSINIHYRQQIMLDRKVIF